MKEERVIFESWKIKKKEKLRVRIPLDEECTVHTTFSGAQLLDVWLQQSVKLFLLLSWANF